MSVNFYLTVGYSYSSKDIEAEAFGFDNYFLPSVSGKYFLLLKINLLIFFLALHGTTKDLFSIFSV